LARISIECGAGIETAYSRTADRTNVVVVVVVVVVTRCAHMA
jgi:hypothetical protein